MIYNKKNRIAILDFYNAKVIIRPLKDETKAEEELAEIEQAERLHMNDCQYMTGEISLDIKEDNLEVPSVKIENMGGNSGREVPNQFIIYTQTGRFFQSYKSIIAFMPYGGGKILLDETYWDYSTTTGKYRNQFLGEGIEETRKKIKSGEYELVNLNK